MNRRHFLGIGIASVAGLLSTKIAAARTILCPWDENPFCHVGQIHVFNQFVGTGSLVAPRVVMTAAHLFFNPLEGITSWPVRKVSFFAGVGLRHGNRVAPYKEFRVQRIVLGPDWLNIAGTGWHADYTKNDWALLLLDRDSSDGPGYFGRDTDIPSDTEIHELLYPDVANNLLQDQVANIERWDDDRLITRGPDRLAAAKGGSGGPFCYRSPSGGWNIVGIHNYHHLKGEENGGQWWHRRLTPDIDQAIRDLS